jgi:metal-dependent amidase/aminoacylase/carboxypeptidase family protein
VTRFDGGTAHNVIPEAVKLAGTVRTFDPEVRATVRAGMERVLRGVTEAHGAGHSFAYVEGYDPVINDAEAAESALRSGIAVFVRTALDYLA